jgi:hypothetical protein
MAKYMQYLFNLRHHTARIVIEQRVCLNPDMEQATHTTHELDRMGRENYIHRQGALGTTEKDLELQAAYHRLSVAEHGLNFARLQLDLTWEEVDMRTHTIIYLENAVEMRISS